MLAIQMPDSGLAMLLENKLGRVAAAVGTRNSSRKVDPPESQYQDVLARGCDKAAGGLSDSSSHALFALFRLNRDRWQLRPEASARRASVQAGREQRPVSGPVPVEAWKGLRRERPLQE
jgi:hypothetical protein